MLFHSSLRKELAQSFGASLLVLFTIVVTMLLIRTLSQATSGGVDPKEVMLVLGYTVLGRLHIILTMALFIAVVSVLTRMHMDSEMVIWMGAGRGMLGLVSPILRFAWPVLLTMSVLVLVAWPWANRQTTELRDRFAQRGDLQRVEPGQFQANADGNRVFFIDKETANGNEGRNVFISTKDTRGEGIISAQAATVVTEGNRQLLLLRNGQRLDTAADQSSYKLSEFEEYLAPVRNDPFTWNDDAGMKTRSTWYLVRNPSAPANGELGWRIGTVVCAFNLLLLGLAVASGNPRIGKSGNIMFALFAFLLYSNLLAVCESWVSRGKAQLIPAFVMLHGTVFVLTCLWITKRHLNIDIWHSLKRTLRRHDPVGKAAA